MATPRQPGAEIEMEMLAAGLKRDGFVVRERVCSARDTNPRGGVG